MGRWKLLSYFPPRLLDWLSRFQPPEMERFLLYACSLSRREMPHDSCATYLGKGGAIAGSLLSVSPRFICSVKLQVSSGILKTLAAWQNKLEAQKNNSFEHSVQCRFRTKNSNVFMKPNINTKAISPVKLTSAALVFLRQKAEEAGGSLLQGRRGRQRQRTMLCQKFCSYLLAVLMLRYRLQVPWGSWYSLLAPLPISFSTLLSVLCSPVVLCSFFCSLCSCPLSSLHAAIPSCPAPCIPAAFSAGDPVPPSMASEAAIPWHWAQLFAAGSSSPLRCDSGASGLAVRWTGAGRRKGCCWSESVGCHANGTHSLASRLLGMMRTAAKACLYWCCLWNPVVIPVPSVLPGRHEEHRHREVILLFSVPALVAQVLGRDRYGDGSAQLFYMGLVPSMDKELSWNTNTALCRHAGNGQKAWTGVTTLPDFKAQLQSIVSQIFF